MIDTMKKSKILMITLLLAVMALTGCKDSKDEPIPDEKTVESFTVNGVSFNMVKVKGGSLTMNMELPVSPYVILYQDSTLEVALADYSIGQTEVTQALWLAVMGDNPSYFSFDNNGSVDRIYDDDLNRPVEWVSWDDCQVFIGKLNELTGRNFKIPSEAEWEFAARGGNKTNGYPYAGGDNIDGVAWFRENSDNMTHPVGQKQPNELGLYDMSGNVREWCSDQVKFTLADGSYTFRIVRGGSYYYNSAAWNRDRATQGVKASDIGLRLAL